MYRRPTIANAIMSMFPFRLTREGNPHQWNPLRKDGALLVPSMEQGSGLYLFTRDGIDYALVDIHPGTGILTFDMMPFTHWFSKPVSPDSHIRNHMRPILMEHGVEYLVSIRGKLTFISDENLLKDHIPVETWFDDKELFPIR